MRGIWLAAMAMAGLWPHAAGAGALSGDAQVSTQIASGGADLGMLLEGSAPTTLHIDAHGGVTLVGGDFVRLRGGDVPPPEVVVRCEPRREEACRAFRQVVVTVTGGQAADWPGRVGGFRIEPATLRGAELVSASVGPEASTFVLACEGGDCGPARTIRFNLAFDVRIEPGAAGRARDAAVRYRVSALWQ